MKKPRGWPPEWFIDTPLVSYEPSVVKTLGSWWRDNVFALHRVTPQGFAEMLIADLPGRNEVRFLTHSHRGPRISPQLQGSAGKALVYLAGHTLTLKRFGGAEEIDLMAVEPQFQGRGIATLIVANLRDAAEVVGIDKVVLRAGLEMGPYVWARLGFVPPDDQWETVKSRISAKLQAPGGIVTQDARNRVFAALASPTGQSIAVIAAEPDFVMSRKASAQIHDVPLGYSLRRIAARDDTVNST